MGGFKKKAPEVLSDGVWEEGVMKGLNVGGGGRGRNKKTHVQ